MNGGGMCRAQLKNRGAMDMMLMLGLNEAVGY